MSTEQATQSEMDYFIDILADVLCMRRRMEAKEQAKPVKMRSEKLSPSAKQGKTLKQYRTKVLRKAA